MIPHPGIHFDRVNITRFPPKIHRCSGIEKKGEVLSYDFLVVNPNGKEMNVATFLSCISHVSPTGGWQFYEQPREYGNHIPREYAQPAEIAPPPHNFVI